MKKVVLVTVGSFNPITFMHLRMFALAKDYLYNKLQWHVLGGIISPVHDAYRKKDLAKMSHRAKMVELALAESHVDSWIKLSRFEIEQGKWSKTVETLTHHQRELNGGMREWFKDITEDDHVQVMMLCGSDVVESFTVPGLWNDHELNDILTKFGVVCITRQGYDMTKIIQTSPRLNQFKDSIIIVPEWFENNASSTIIRDAVRKGAPISMLVATSVEEFIREHHLYVLDEHSGTTKPLIFVFKATKSTGLTDPYEEALNKAGWRVAMVPVLNFQYLGVPEYAAALFQPDNFSGLILTSPRAVEALLIAVQADSKGWESLHKSKWNAKPIYVVGEGTGALAASAGLTPVGHEAGNETALAEIIGANKSQHSQQPLLFPCGNLRLETLRLKLEERNIPMECVLVYETSPHPELVAVVQERIKSEGFPDVNLFFSPSGIQFVDEILRAESLAFKQTKYVAIGPTTAEALKDVGYHVDAVAEKPNPESVIAALTKLVKK